MLTRFLSDGVQEAIAIAVVLVALVYLLDRLVGLRARFGLRRRTQKAQVVTLGPRLARGLKTAKHGRTRRLRRGA